MEVKYCLKEVYFLMANEPFVALPKFIRHKFENLLFHEQNYRKTFDSQYRQRG
jgi:hypothetical protein